MLPQEIIRRKRDGEELPREIIFSLITDFMSGKISDYQMSAFLMAVYFRGMSFDETVAMTEAFIDSGDRLDLSLLHTIPVDKHSTGGVGDKISLLLVPVVAAAGVCVPMISGRALGHTGGTLDKLESIPGFVTSLSPDQFITQLKKVGAAMIGQTERMVPADRRIYAIRDVSATVEILPVIAASIMSKKIAGGANALVLDVKTGQGAFIESDDKSRELAKLLVDVASHFGIATTGFITGMDEPLGKAIGNWLEVVETIDCLRGYNIPDIIEVTTSLAGAMIFAGKKSSSITEGIRIAEEMIASGLAYEKFIELVEAQHGDTKVIENTLAYPNPTVMLEVHAAENGYVRSIDSRALGLLAIELGAGRKSIMEKVDPTAGIILKKKCGDDVEAGDALCILCSSTCTDLFEMKHRASSAFRILPNLVLTSERVKVYFDQTGFYPWNNYRVQCASDRTG